MPLRGLIELERNPYTAVYHDPAQQLVFLKRFSPPYPSLGEVEQNFQRLEQALGIISRRRSLLLVDARDAPMRNDDRFEATFAPSNARLMHGFKKTAVLLKSAIGVLQVERLSKGQVRPVGTFTRPEEALLHLGVRIDLAQFSGS